MTNTTSAFSDQHGERTPSALDQACDAYVRDIAALLPTAATAFGIAGYDDKLEDHSPELNDKLAERTRQLHQLAQRTLDNGTAQDHVDEVTARVLVDRLGVELQSHELNEDLANLNNIASPLQGVRDTLSLMPQETQEQKDNIRARMGLIPQAMAGYRESLALGAERGVVAAARQVKEVARQAEQLATGEILGSFGVPADAAEVTAAKQAFGELSRWLTEELLPKAPEADGVGRERYEVASHNYVGARVDLDEAYEWGAERLREIAAEQEQIAMDLYGTRDVAEAFRRLDEEPKYTINGTDNLREWMQSTADGAVADMAGEHFEIPAVMRTIEACIDPAGSGGIFYTAPSDDFSRPGRMWWSVPEGQTQFHTWQELTTVFHEGVPGHHLQIGAAMCNPDLNMWRRLACWNSGHGEGWALYAENLMAELGYHDDPANRMGMLDAQRLRAARILIDIGTHLGKKNPDGGQWTWEYAQEFFASHVAMAPENRQFELMRYFGWPGQAPSYALGQRLWQQLRDDAKAKGMSLKQFHAAALPLGSIPMDILRDEVLAQA